MALGTQAMDAYKQSKLNEAKADIRAQMAANGELDGLTEAQINKKIVDSAQYQSVDKEYGVGSNFWTNGSAATGLLAGVLGGNVTGGIAAGAAPYMAALVKDSTDNPAARAALHAIVSGALASAQGANPGAAAAGGFIASASADALAMAFYGTTADKLVGDEKTMISNLVVLLGAAAGAAAGGDGQAIASGGNAARVEVENNALSMDETKARDKELASCTTAECKQAVRAKYFDLYFSNEDKAEKCTSAAQCMSVYHELQAEQKEYAQREQELRNNFSNLNDEEKKELFALQKVIQNYDGTKNAALHYATRYADDGSPISEVDKAILAAGVGGIGNSTTSRPSASSKDKNVEIWTETKKKDSVSNAYGHWKKHGSEFPELQNAKQYVDATHSFVTSPPAGTLIKTRTNGDTLYYNPATNTFASKDANGVPRTMFKPEKGIEYWNKQ